MKKLIRVIKFVKRIFKTFLLFLIVTIYFLFIFLPMSLVKLFYDLINSKRNWEALYVYEDIHTFDARSWYRQYIDKGFSFLLSSSHIIGKADYNVLKFLIFINRKRWVRYVLLTFKRIFVVQKIQIIYLLNLIWVFSSRRAYWSLFYYFFLTFLRMLLGEWISFFWGWESEKRTRIFIALKDKFMEGATAQDLILLRRLRKNYFAKKHKKALKNHRRIYILKKIMLFIYINILKVILLIINILRRFAIVFLNNIIIYNFIKIINYMFEFWIKDFIYLTHTKFLNLIKKRWSSRDSNSSYIENSHYNKSLLSLYIYKFEILSLNRFIRLKKDANRQVIDLEKLLLDSKLQKFNDFEFKSKDSTFRFRNILFLYNLFKLYKNKIFLNLKTINLTTIMRNWKTYKSALTFNLSYYYMLFWKYMWKTILSEVLQYDFETLNLYWRGNNVMYSLVEDYVIVWDYSGKFSRHDSRLRFFHWALNVSWRRELYISLFYKSILNILRKRLRLKHKYLKSLDLEFNFKLLLFLNHTSSLKEFFDFLFDKYYNDILLNYKLYNLISEDFKGPLMKQIKDGFNLKTLNDKAKALEYLVELIKEYVVLYDAEEPIEDIYTILETIKEEEINIKQVLYQKNNLYKRLSSNFDISLKKVGSDFFEGILSDVWVDIDYIFDFVLDIYENSFFFFKNVKTKGFDFFDLSWQDKSYFEFINIKYVRLLSSKLNFANSLLYKLNIRFAKLGDTAFFYKLFNHRKKWHLFLFGNLFELNNKYFIFNNLFSKYGLSFMKEDIKRIKYLKILRRILRQPILFFCLNLFKISKRNYFIRFKIYFIISYILQEIAKKKRLSKCNKKEKELSNLFKLDEFDMNEIFYNLFLFKSALNHLSLKNLLYFEYLFLVHSLNKYIILFKKRDKSNFIFIFYIFELFFIKLPFYFLLFIIVKIFKIIIEFFKRIL